MASLSHEVQQVELRATCRGDKISPNWCCTIVHFTVVCLVTWPLSGSEAGGDHVLIQTLLLFTCKSCCSHANKFAFAYEKHEVCIKTRSPPASLPLQGQVTRHTTVKWTIIKVSVHTRGHVAATYPWDIYPQHFHVCANVIILSLPDMCSLHVRATCRLSVYRWADTRGYVAGTCRSDMLQRQKLV